MGEITILLADDGSGILSEFALLLRRCQAFRVVGCTDRQEEVLPLLEQSRAKVLVMLLGSVEALSLLEQLQRRRESGTRVLVCTCFSSGALVRRLRALGVAQLVALPCTAQALEEHIRLVAEGIPLWGSREQYLEVRTGHLLQRLGLTPNQKCYRYLFRAICLWVQEGEEHAGVTKWIYPCVGRCCGVSAAAVERCIRQTIRRLWSREPGELLCRLFSPQEGTCPTNARFISVLAQYLEQTWGEMAI